jgi:hypothetical protein
MFTNAVIIPHNRSRELARIALFSALLSLPALPATALTLQQSFSNSYSQTSFGLGTVVVHPPLTSFSVQPFDVSLGTLNTATIEWNTGAIGSVVVATGTTGGSLGFDFGGGVNLNVFAYGGYGGGGGDGAGQGQSIGVNLAPQGTTDTFSAANAGVTFDAGIWDAILGTTPFTLSYTGSYPGGTPYRITSINIASGNASMTTTATVRYDYSPGNPIVPVPGPCPLWASAPPGDGAVVSEGALTSRLDRRRADDPPLRPLPHDFGGAWGKGLSDRDRRKFFGDPGGADSGAGVS